MLPEPLVLSVQQELQAHRACREMLVPQAQRVRKVFKALLDSQVHKVQRVILALQDRLDRPDHKAFKA